MRIGKTEPVKIVVTIAQHRPAKSGEKNKRGKTLKEGQVVRTTHESIDVYEASPEQVSEVIVNALKAASNRK